MKDSGIKIIGNDADNSKRGNFAFILRALGYRNYRLFISGQLVSLVGTWMTSVATSWLVYRLTGSALLLGIVNFAALIPSFLLSPFAGVMIDRWNRRRLLVLTQTLAMLQSFLLAGLTLKGIITITDIILLSIVQGLINAFDMPARQAFVVEMVERKEDLANAIALNSSMFNFARLLGPSLGGVIIAAVGEGWCFFIDGISYLAVIASLLAMRISARATQHHKDEKVFAQLRAGWRYVNEFPAIREILLLIAFISLVGMPYTVLMPVFATRVLHGGPNTLGMLMAASGIGALLGGVVLAARKTVVGLGRVIWLAAALFGGGLMLFALSHSLILSLPLMLLTGIGFMLQMASSNTLLQTVVDDQMRGRVMSFYTMAFMGTTPFGGLIAGALANHIGAQVTLLICGALCIIGAIAFASVLPGLRARVRPLYIKMGILPEVAAGVQSASELTSPNH